MTRTCVRVSDSLDIRSGARESLSCYRAAVSNIYDDVLRYMEDSTDGSFEALALAVFAQQFACSEPYRRYCLDRGKAPQSVDEWCRIPAVPVAVYDELELCCGQPQRTFLSDRADAAGGRRTRHQLPDLRLLHRATLLALRRFVFPDVERMRLISMTPPTTAEPDSALAQRIAWAIDEFGDEGSAYAADTAGFHFDALVDLLRVAERSGQPVGLVSPTGILLSVIDHARNQHLSFRLPHGSRVLNTGPHGRVHRPLSRKGLLHACWSTFAIPGYFCVNEHRITELSSRFYDSVITDRVHGRHRGRHQGGPHWVRTLVLGPESLAPVRSGTGGLLCHFDLASAGTAMAVITKDFGRVVGDGFQLAARVRGAGVRGRGPGRTDP